MQMSSYFNCGELLLLICAVNQLQTILAVCHFRESKREEAIMLAMLHQPILYNLSLPEY